MVASVRSASQAGAATGNPVVTKPAGTIDGDVLIAICFKDTDSAGGVTAPGGWTQRGATTTQASVSVCTVFTKVAASEGASYTFTGNPGSTSTVAMLAIQDADTTTPVDVGPAFGGGAASTSHVAPSVSPAGADSLLVCSANALITGAVPTTYTPPGGMTEQTDLTTGNWLTQSSATQELAASGATGTKTFTCSRSVPWQTVSIAIKSAAAGGTNAPAGLTSGTGVAPQPTPSIRTNAASVTGSGLAPQPAVTTSGQTSASAGAAAGSGGAPQPSASIRTGAGAGAGTGAAPFDASGNSVSLQMIADSAVPGTGAAPQPTISTAAQAQAPAGVANGTSVALQPSVAVRANSDPGAGTGSAQQPIVSTSGAANAPAGVGTGAGVAHQPTVSTSGNTSALAGLALGTGGSPQLLATVVKAVSAGLGASSGAAFAAALAIKAFPSIAAGTSAAPAASVPPQYSPGVMEPGQKPVPAMSPDTEGVPAMTPA